MPGGIEACNCGIRARTRSTVSMMLAPGWRKMTTAIAGFPLAWPPTRMSSTESVTEAMSDKRTAAPRLYAMISGLYCSAVSS